MSARGEYKTPGGKLIAVEFDVANGALCNVVVTGDFFLYPEDALSGLAGALEGSSTNLDKEGYAARVRSALNKSGELVGSSPEALAMAVIRALEGLSPSGRGDDQ